MLLFAYIFIVIFLFFALFAVCMLILELKNGFVVLILEALTASTFLFALLKIGAQIAAIL